MNDIRIMEANQLSVMQIFDLVDRIFPQMGPDQKPTWTIQTIEALAKDERDRLFIAAYQENLVGMLTFNLQNRLKGKRGWIHDVIIDEPYRGKGIGKMLVDHAIAYGREQGATQIDLISEDYRKQAHHVYHAAGFESESLFYFELDLSH